jgi:hypothetical protein
MQKREIYSQLFLARRLVGRIFFASGALPLFEILKEVLRFHIFEVFLKGFDFVVRDGLEQLGTFLKNGFRNKHRAFGPDRKGQGVTGARVDHAGGAIRTQVNFGKIGIVPEVRDHDFFQIDMGRFEHGAHQVVRHRTRGFLAGEFRRDRASFKDTDPNGDQSRPAELFDHHDAAVYDLREGEDLGFS